MGHIIIRPTIGSSLTANSKKLTASWVGPFVVYQVLDRTHYILADLKGRILKDVFNFNRLKPGFLKTTDHENISNLHKLRQVLKSKDKIEASPAVSCTTVDYDFTDEFGKQLPTPQDSEMVYYAQTAPLDLTKYVECLSHNNGFAAPTELSEAHQQRLLQALLNAPSSDAVYSVCKARFKASNLQLLLSLPLPRKKTYQFWWDISSRRYQLSTCGRSHTESTVWYYMPWISPKVYEASVCHVDAYLSVTLTKCTQNVNQTSSL